MTTDNVLQRDSKTFIEDRRPREISEGLFILFVVVLIVFATIGVIMTMWAAVAFFSGNGMVVVQPRVVAATTSTT